MELSIAEPVRLAGQRTQAVPQGRPKSDPVSFDMELVGSRSAMASSSGSCGRSRCSSQNLAEARRVIGEFITRCNTECLIERLGHQTPVAARTAANGITDETRSHRASGSNDRGWGIMSMSISRVQETGSGTPASASFRIPMSFSSVNRFRRIAGSTRGLPTS